MKTAKTIDEVLEQLDQIVSETLRENSYACIFAYVYRHTTAGIKQAILDNRFEDDERMERLDVIFANLYIQAYYDNKNNLPVSRSWKASFDIQHEPVTIIQHLLLGMNAHINHDLGQAASLVCKPDKLDDLEHDFMVVNKILAEMTDEMQKKLGLVSPLLFLLDVLGKRKDELLVNFSMTKAREQAWRLTRELALLTDEQERKARVDIADGNVAALSRLLTKPPGKLLNFILRLVGMLEERDIKKIIKRLSSN